MEQFSRGWRSTPPLIQLERIYQASRPVECGQETTEDLRYLQGKDTSLGWYTAEMYSGG